MTLYDHPDCPYGMKVRIVLAEKEFDYEFVSVDLKGGHHKRPEFLKLNPFGRVPVLVDEDCALYDSTIINEYLDDEYPAPELKPTDSDERARVRLLEDYADTSFTLPVMALEAELSKAAPQRNEQRLSHAREVITQGLAMLDRELADKEYLAGEFSLADIAFAPAALRLERLGISVDASLSNVREWIARLSARPSIGTVLKLVA